MSCQMVPNGAGSALSTWAPMTLKCKGSVSLYQFLNTYSGRSFIWHMATQSQFPQMNLFFPSDQKRSSGEASARGGAGPKPELELHEVTKRIMRRGCLEQQSPGPSYSLFLGS